MARIFITGSTDGLGRAAAGVLMDEGHDVVLHARTRERASALSDLVPDAAGIVLGDLSSAAQTRELAGQVNDIGRMDAVIHNAGVYLEPSRSTTAEGHAKTLAVNILAPYLLTALIDRPDRLIYLSSGLHHAGAGSLGDIDWTRRRWNAAQAYAESKLHITALVECRCLVLVLVVAWRIYLLPLPEWAFVMASRMKRPVTLTAGDRDELVRISTTGVHPASMIRRARVLLALDDSAGEVDPKEVIAAKAGVTGETVRLVARRFEETGGDAFATIARKQREQPPVPSQITGEVEARLIALACSRPPAGHARWSLRLLEKHVALAQDIPDMDHSTIGRVLKKRSFVLI